ncbi:MAG: NAD(P)-dependent glycerol-3-phosphate dehydrogenase [Candidatus Omnitrophica bacterium]|nr:NAD(P)-dependent glycerol-3-phosphate dehydrogenase [Candidatus Omnitrophota bacterium]
MTKKPNIAVLGDGGWGTTLAILLHKKGLPVTLWGAFDDYVRQTSKSHINKKFLPGIKIPSGIVITSDLKKALDSKDIIIFAIPSQYMRGVLRKIKVLNNLPLKAIYVSVTKGIEIASLKCMSEIIREELGNLKLTVLSGPTIAHELAKGLPTAAVIASRHRNLREYLQNVFTTKVFRIYTNDDVIGVELGGSLKNVIAISCGISDGLGFGTNTKAALLSRGLREISRLGLAMGAKRETFSGLSGLGDLVTTCISPYSRNRCVGEEFAKGKTLKEINSKMQMVAEGVPTAKSGYELGLKYKIDMPITREIYLVLYKNKSPRKAVVDLMSRQRKEE